MSLPETNGFITYGKNKWKCPRNHKILNTNLACQKCIHEDYGITITYKDIRDEFIVFEPSGWNYDYKYFDGYNKKIKLAYVFDPPQDMIYMRIFHGKYENFKKIRDVKYKRKKFCEKFGIKLVIIPCKLSKSDLPYYIRDVVACDRSKACDKKIYFLNRTRYNIIKFLLYKCEIDKNVDNVYNIMYQNDLNTIINCMLFFSKKYDFNTLYKLALKFIDEI